MSMEVCKGELFETCPIHTAVSTKKTGGTVSDVEDQASMQERDTVFRQDLPEHEHVAAEVKDRFRHCAEFVGCWAAAERESGEY